MKRLTLGVLFLLALCSFARARAPINPWPAIEARLKKAAAPFDRLLLKPHTILVKRKAHYKPMYHEKTALHQNSVLLAGASQRGTSNPATLQTIERFVPAFRQ